MVQSRPITFGRQRHWPPNGSQVSLSAPTSWQPHGKAPLLKNADRDTAEVRQKAEEVEELQERHKLPFHGETTSTELLFLTTDLMEKLFWPQLLMKS